MRCTRRNCWRWREAFSRGALDLDIGHGNFDYGSHRDFLAKRAAEIASFEDCRRTAFSAELEEWKARGVLTFESAETNGAVQPDEDMDDTAFVTSPMAGSVWSVHVRARSARSNGRLAVHSRVHEDRVSGECADRGAWWQKC